MNKANLPTEKAYEPHEEARQPQPAVTMSPPIEQTPSKRFITFAGNKGSTGNSSAQKSSSYKEALSQPAPGLSHRQRLLWLQRRRAAGLWAQCDDCERWRYLPNVLDSSELPSKWYCRMNPEAAVASCAIPEVPIRIREEEDLIHSEYSAGSVVWARLAGWPWWPAMVDDCPDTEQFYWLDGFSDIPTHYNVVFFDAVDVTRAWVAPGQLRPYAACKNKYLLNDKKYKKRLQAAATQADDAAVLPLVDRFAKYSFIARYKGNITSPKRVSKKHVSKYQRQFKRKFNIEFPVESSSESDDSTPASSLKKSNVILLGTPKKSKAAQSYMPKNIKGAVGALKLHDSLIQNGDGRKADGSAKTDTKHANSMTVQVGSNVNTEAFTASIDNDTSKTYVPDTETEPTVTEARTGSSQSGFHDFQVRIASPSSDNFEF